MPGSCPENIAAISAAVPTLGKLDVLTKSISKDTEKVEFEIRATTEEVDPTIASIVYLSGQNKPVTVKIESGRSGPSGEMRFDAAFPFKSANFANGLTIAALVKGTDQFDSAEAVAKASINGPGLIEVE